MYILTYCVRFDDAHYLTFIKDNYYKMVLQVMLI